MRILKEPHSQLQNQGFFKSENDDRADRLRILSVVDLQERGYIGLEILILRLSIRFNGQFRSQTP